MDEAQLLDRYRRGLRVANRALRMLGRSSVDGREAHDFAMQSLFGEYWGTRRVWFDVIDAYRKERGRSSSRGAKLGRKFHQLPYWLATRDPPLENDWMRAWVLSPAEKRMAVLLAEGLTKTEVSKRLGVSQAAISALLRQIRNRLELDKSGTLGP